MIHVVLHASLRCQRHSDLIEFFDLRQLNGCQPLGRSARAIGITPAGCGRYFTCVLGGPSTCVDVSAFSILLSPLRCPSRSVGHIYVGFVFRVVLLERPLLDRLRTFGVSGLPALHARASLIRISRAPGTRFRAVAQLAIRAKTIGLLPVNAKLVKRLGLLAFKAGFHIASFARASAFVTCSSGTFISGSVFFACWRNAARAARRILSASAAWSRPT